MRHKFQHKAIATLCLMLWGCSPGDSAKEMNQAALPDGTLVDAAAVDTDTETSDTREDAQPTDTVIRADSADSADAQDVSAPPDTGLIDVQLSVTIAPQKPTTTDGLVAAVEGLNPRDGLPELELKWARDGQLVPLELDPAHVLPASHTKAGEVWSVRVSVVGEETVLAEATVVIRNTAPTCSAAELEPALPTAGEAISCTCTERIDPGCQYEPLLCDGEPCTTDTDCATDDLCITAQCVAT